MLFQSAWEIFPSSFRVFKVTTAAVTVSSAIFKGSIAGWVVGLPLLTVQPDCMASGQTRPTIRTNDSRVRFMETILQMERVLEKGTLLLWVSTTAGTAGMTVEATTGGTTGKATGTSPVAAGRITGVAVLSTQATVATFTSGAVLSSSTLALY